MSRRSVAAGSAIAGGSGTLADRVMRRGRPGPVWESAFSGGQRGPEHDASAGAAG